MTTQEILQAAQTARLPLALADTHAKNAALEAMAVALVAAQEEILAANQRDLEAARGRVSDVMLDRLALTPSRLTDMAKGMREVAALPDPVGTVLRKIVRPNGLVIEKTAVPMGVIAIIYESRPNVTSDAAALAVKAGSACVLRCGRDAWASCHAIVEALRAGLRKAHLPENAISLIEDTSHASANELMTADGLVDLLIPRGGAGPQRRTGAAGQPLNLRSDLFHHRDQLRVGIGVGVGSVQAVDIGKQDHQIRVDALGHQCGQRIVVAKGIFLDGDGVVFVDDGDGTQLEQPLQRAAKIAQPVFVVKIFPGQQHLCHGMIVLAE